MSVQRNWNMKMIYNTHKFNHDEWYNELWNLANKLRPYYDIDKVKDYAVYVWTKPEESDRNVFDIYPDRLEIYDFEHNIKEDAKPIIKQIHRKLRENPNNH